MNQVARSLWHEPRAPNPPSRGWSDWSLVGVLTVAGVLEALLRPDVANRPLALIVGIVPIFTLLWRRSDPLLAVVAAWVAVTGSDFVPLIEGPHSSDGLYVFGFVLLLSYSLTRWGSGREVGIGIAVMLAKAIPTAILDLPNVGEMIAAVAFLMFPAMMGAAIRYRGVSRAREVSQIKLLEREQLARELHDIVAHHVSAIAVQAQAGRTVATNNPAAALRALNVIETEASRTLKEMRYMVGALRDGEEADVAPQRGVADIARLASRSGDAPTVEVTPTGNLDDLTPSVDAAVYRLAQESITNALRHARHASLVRVDVAGEPDCIRLTVTDDGDATAYGGSGTGYGIIGMTERATLLGGTLSAGPDACGGWTVAAVLPRNGASS